MLDLVLAIARKGLGERRGGGTPAQDHVGFISGREGRREGGRKGVRCVCCILFLP